VQGSWCAGKIGFTIPVIISPDAIVDQSVTIGEGTVVIPGVVINVDVFIGKNCIINTKSSIDHDCITLLEITCI